MRNDSAILLHQQQKQFKRLRVQADNYAITPQRKAAPIKLQLADLPSVIGVFYSHSFRKSSDPGQDFSPRNGEDTSMGQQAEHRH
jgi:hypothetical protein